MITYLDYKEFIDYKYELRGQYIELPSEINTI